MGAASLHVLSMCPPQTQLPMGTAFFASVVVVVIVNMSITAAAPNGDRVFCR
jgi:hypothetical protein